MSDPTDWNWMLIRCGDVGAAGTGYSSARLATLLSKYPVAILLDRRRAKEGKMLIVRMGTGNIYIFHR